MEEKRENPRILSIIHEDGNTYFLCNDGYIYETDESQTTLRRLGKDDKDLIDKIKSRFEHPGLIDIDETEEDIEGR